MFDNVEIDWYWLVLTVVVVIAIVAAVCALIAYIQKKKGISGSYSTRDMTFGGVCIAIAYGLSFFGNTMPQEGTVTPASVLPIIIYCYYFGFVKGAGICSVYMILQLFQHPSIISPYSALLDYLIPYMALCLTGIFSFNQKRYNKVLIENKHVLMAHYPIYFGCVLYAVVRYASHVLSGVLFYAEWAWDGYSPLAYSLAYNSFALIDAIIAIVALTALLYSKTFNTFMASNRNALQYSNAATKDNQ